MILDAVYKMLSNNGVHSPVEVVIMLVLSTICTYLFMAHIHKKIEEENNINRLRDTGKTLEELKKEWKDGN